MSSLSLLPTDASSSAASAREGAAVDGRISKVLALRTDSAAMLEALDAISEFYRSVSAPDDVDVYYDLSLHLTETFVFNQQKLTNKQIY